MRLIIRGELVAHVASRIAGSVMGWGAADVSGRLGLLGFIQNNLFNLGKRTIRYHRQIRKIVRGRATARVRLGNVEPEDYLPLAGRDSTVA